MTEFDKEYFSLLNNIIKNGTEKDTRAGRVKSVFGRMLRFDLKSGLPILTTKKMFSKGVIHELLWFISGDTNIKYLVDNNIHIWDDDAYRYYLEISNVNEKFSKDEFIDAVREERTFAFPTDKEWLLRYYKAGDLGHVYGKQWRSFGEKHVDQLSNVIETLKTNPNDRRMLVVAYNPDVVKDVALPPCHVMFQFYTRELTTNERWELYKQKYKDEPINPTNFSRGHLEMAAMTSGLFYNGEFDHELEEENIPKYGLSCMWSQRSVDSFLGLPFNILSYAILTCMIAKITNMAPDELIGSLGDCHIYEAHYDAVKEQLSRNGSDVIPKLIIHGDQKTIDDFKYDDFEIIDYYPDSIIKAPLLVG